MQRKGTLDKEGVLSTTTPEAKDAVRLRVLSAVLLPLAAMYFRNNKKKLTHLPYYVIRQSLKVRHCFQTVQSINNRISVAQQRCGSGFGDGSSTFWRISETSYGHERSCERWIASSVYQTPLGSML